MGMVLFKHIIEKSNMFLVKFCCTIVSLLKLHDNNNVLSIQ